MCCLVFVLGVCCLSVVLCVGDGVTCCWLSLLDVGCLMVVGC